ncbi:calcium-binding protein [Phenylobacterium soli]|uniref:calcium-binding protein n=1 Tax=Phenylobacterium soli TaxID=2170551 RepID=UPI001403DA61|nr:calcium-binding protein [Phenylobacterium soli]
MTAYSFETITADEALNIQTGDYLTLHSGPAARAVVRYLAATPDLPARIELSVGERTVVFGQNLAGLSLRGALDVTDGSRLVIGDADRQSTGGTLGHDALYGGEGHDIVHGLAGDDRVQGNAGNDTLYGDGGADTISGGQGDDRIELGATGDLHGGWAHGNKGDDQLYGGAGNDTLLGGQGDDAITGREGDDYISGDLGNDVLFGGAGNDTIHGGDGDDEIKTSGGDDVVDAGRGDDIVTITGSGTTYVDGGDGVDRIVIAGDGKDVVLGGAWADIFEIHASVPPPSDPTHWDEIRDWSADEHLLFAQVHAVADILPRSYSEFVAADFPEAYRIANEHIAATGAIYVAAQVGGNVFVFADTDGNAANGADAGVMLAGRTLFDIALSNFL